MIHAPSVAIALAWRDGYGNLATTGRCTGRRGKAEHISPNIKIRLHMVLAKPTVARSLVKPRAQRASVGSTEASNGGLARVGVVGPKRAAWRSVRVRPVNRTGKELLPGFGGSGSLVVPAPSFGEPSTSSCAWSGGVKRSSGRVASSSIRAGSLRPGSTCLAKTSCTADPNRGGATGWPIRTSRHALSSPRPSRPAVLTLTVQPPASRRYPIGALEPGSGGGRFRARISEEIRGIWKGLAGVSK
jgi:hypothetical protein